MQNRIWCRGLLLIAVAGCQPSATELDASVEAESDAGLHDGGASAADAGWVPPACLGPSLPLERSGQLPFVTVKVGAAPGSPGAFLVDFASTASWVDLNAFPAPAPRPVSCQGDPAIPGASCLFADFDFFGSWGQVALRTADFSAVTSTPRECGLLGTDFLSVKPTTLDFEGGRMFWSKDAGFCSDAELLAAGLTPLSTEGFFSTDTSKLVPLKQVIPDGGSDISNYTVPNVPTVKVRIAGVEALAQLDTGFDDNLIRHSININEAYLDALLAGSPNRLVRAASLDQFISTCVGLTETAEAYRLAAGQTAAFVSATDQLVRAQSEVVLFVKHTPPAAKVCGGIGTWAVPAAQIAGSFFVDAKVVVFDPVRQRVWLRAQP